MCGCSASCSARRSAALKASALFALVEEVRALAKRAHAGEPGRFEQLADRLTDLPIAAAVPIARAFAQFLTLANIAEQHHRVRRRRAVRARHRAARSPARAHDAFARWRADGLSADALVDAVTIAADRAGAHRAPDGDRSAHAAADASPDRRSPRRSATGPI